MFRKSTLALAAVFALGAASLLSASTSADAAPGGHGMRGHGGHGGMGAIGMRAPGGHGGLGGWHRPGRFPGHVHLPGRHWNPHWYPRRYWGGYYVRPVAVAPVAVAPVYRANCNCLTKEYTLDGQIVFRDLCTQETASSLVPGAAPAAPPAQQSSEAAQPNNFAGRTYQDFLAANGQQAQAQRAN